MKFCLWFRWQKKQLVCSCNQHKRPIFPSRNRSLISRGISTFLMISFDNDKLLNALIYFCCFPRYISSTVDLCVYTSDKHFVRSRFILIAPLCQRLLMIFYRTLHSVFHHCLFVLDGMARWKDLDTDQTASHLWGNSWLHNQFWSWAHIKKGANDLKVVKYLVIVYSCSRPEQTSLCKGSDAKHMIFCLAKPSELTKHKT